MSEADTDDHRTFAFTVDYVGFAQKMLSGVLGRSNLLRGEFVSGRNAVGFTANLPISLEGGVLLCRKSMSRRSRFDDLVLDLATDGGLLLVSDLHWHDSENDQAKAAAVSSAGALAGIGGQAITLIIVGDWLDTWQATLLDQPLRRRPWIRRSGLPCDPAEITAGSRLFNQYRELIEQLQRQFAKIVFIPGNHDRAFLVAPDLRALLERCGIIVVRDLLVAGRLERYAEFLESDSRNYIIKPLQMIMRARLGRRSIPFPFIYVYHGHEHSSANAIGQMLGLSIARVFEALAVKRGCESHR